jgi:hypothetical protein
LNVIEGVKQAAEQDTTSESWRHECEVRHVMNMPLREQRALYVMDVERKRGAAAAKRLRDDVIKAWNATSDRPISPSSGERENRAGSLRVNTEGEPGHGSFLQSPNQGNASLDVSVDSEGRAS